MKKIITGLTATILLTGALFFCGFFRNELLSAENSAKELDREKKVEYIPQLDQGFLDYYGIDDFETDLPVMFIDTTEGEINRYSPVMSKVSIINAANDGSMRRMTDIPDLTLDAAVKHRGASSTNFEKKQYRIKFYKDSSQNKSLNYDLFGMGAASEWVLHGPFLDKSLARNYLVYSVSNEILEWAPECRYLELFVDGKYQGVYLAVEPVSNGPGRLRLSTFGLFSGRCAYIVGRDREGSDLAPLETYGKTDGFTSNDLYVEYPGRHSITEAEYNWITDDISDFERTLYGNDYDDPDSGYAAYIDVDNFVDYFLINEVVMNHDAGNLSSYAYKELGGKLCMTVWDFNNCYDNYQWFAQDLDEFYTLEAAWFKRMITDRAFVDRLVKRYHELRENEFSSFHFHELVDESASILSEAQKRNYQVWGYTFKSNLLEGKGRDLKSYEDAVAQLNYAIDRRFEFMDDHIEDLYMYCEN